MTKKDEFGNEAGLSPEQKRALEKVSEADIKEIDRLILENATNNWCKASRIVLTTMIEREEGITGLPETFYSERIATLVREGLLESRGDLSNMKVSEVRLVEKK